MNRKHSKLLCELLSTLIWVIYTWRNCQSWNCFSTSWIDWSPFKLPSCISTWKMSRWMQVFSHLLGLLLNSPALLQLQMSSSKAWHQNKSKVRILLALIYFNFGIISLHLDGKVYSKWACTSWEPMKSNYFSYHLRKFGASWESPRSKCLILTVQPWIQSRISCTEYKKQVSGMRHHQRSPSRSLMKTTWLYIWGSSAASTKMMMANLSIFPIWSASSSRSLIRKCSSQR